MESLKPKKSLVLKKVTVARLIPEFMSEIRGGGTSAPLAGNGKSRKVSCYQPADDYPETDPRHNTSVNMNLCL